MSAGPADWAVLSLGSNLGDREAHLAAGLEVVATVTPVVAVSDVYETEPVGGVDQPQFLNLAALVATGDPERALLAAHSAEDARGRLRQRRWGPRTLDVDVVAVGARRSADPRLTLPHPRAHERAFVLRPWLDLDADAELPGHGAVRDCLRRTGEQGLRRVGPPPRWWR
jgi:2-amino-4-hydroxy-6-hydroxymethyldihydropteridine diphosphokinase